MRRNQCFSLFLLLIFAMTGCAGSSARPATLHQVGVIDALLAGGYHGSRTLGELRSLGDLGLGTFDALDGELVLLDGRVYQVPASGLVQTPPDGVTTPFAQATVFAPTASLPLPAGGDLHAVEAALDKAIGDANVFAAVRVEAAFATLSTRSVPRQAEPYRTLAEVAKEQTVFKLDGARGTLVGLRGPAFARGLGVPGWHWHFLTADRTRGGHVLSFTLAPAAVAKLQRMTRLELLLPESGLGAFDLARDRSSELKAVESGQ